MSLYLRITAASLVFSQIGRHLVYPTSGLSLVRLLNLAVILALLEVWTAKTDEYYIKSLIRMNYNIDRELCIKV